MTRPPSALVRELGAQKRGPNPSSYPFPFRVCRKCAGGVEPAASGATGMLLTARVQRGPSEAARCTSTEINQGAPSSAWWGYLPRRTRKVLGLHRHVHKRRQTVRPFFIRHPQLEPEQFRNRHVRGEKRGFGIVGI